MTCGPSTRVREHPTHLKRSSPMSSPVFIDIQATQNPIYRERGIPRYTAECAAALLKREAPIAALALNPMLPAPRLDPELARAPELRWNTAQTFSAARRGGSLLYHVMSPFVENTSVQGEMPRYALTSDIPLVVTLYDLIPLIFPDWYWHSATARRAYLARLELVKRADLVLSLSESTRRDAIELLGVPSEKVVVVGAGASSSFRAPSSDEHPERVVRSLGFGINRPFVFSVSGADPRKNPGVLFQAWARLPAAIRREHQLVVTCGLPAGWGKRFWAQVADAGLDPEEVVLTGVVSDEVLRSLYQAAALFVFTSSYEGFGLPLLEAARCGTPAITARNSSLTELFDFAPATFATHDPDELAALISRSLRDPTFRARLREVEGRAAARQSWDAVADRMLAGYRRFDDFLPRHHQPADPPPLRVALVGPFPPIPSRLSAYNASLAAALAPRCTLDCFLEPGSGRPVIPRTRALPVTHFPRCNPASYDLVLYALNASTLHPDTLAMASLYPGVPWLHDVEGTRDARDPQLGAPTAERTPRRPERAHTDHRILPGDRWDHSALPDAADVRSVAELTMRSKAVIVSCQLEAQLLAREVGSPDEAPPVHVLPLAPRSVPGPASRWEFSDVAERLLTFA